MIPHIDKNGEACIIVAINSEARAKAAKIMGTVSLGNKAIKGVAKVREAMQASAAGRGEPPKMNMATSIASGKQRLSDKRKASDAAETAAGFIPSKTFGGKQSNVRREDRRLKVQDVRAQGFWNTKRSKEKKADLAAVAAKEATAAAKRPARQAAARRGISTKAFNQQEAAKRSNKGKMSKANRGLSNQTRREKSLSQTMLSFPRRDKFQASGGFDRVSERLGGKNFRTLKNVIK